MCIRDRGYTELFFYDEASALAAGHRPCFECQRQRAKEFQAAFSQALNAAHPLKAQDIDSALHKDRTSGIDRKVLSKAKLQDGTFVTYDGYSGVILNGNFHRWTDKGYEFGTPIKRDALLLTPATTIKAFQAGFTPTINI